MTANEPTTKRLWINRIVSLDPILFVVAFFYLWHVVQPHLMYHAFGTLLPGAVPFSTGWSFVKEVFTMPGAGVAYLVGLLSQGYADSFLGALIVVGLAFVLVELTRLHFILAGIRRLVILTRLPAVVLFLIVSQYHHGLGAFLIVLMGLLFSGVFEKIPCHKPLPRTVLYGFMTAFGYAVMGAGGIYVFVSMTVVHLVKRRQWLRVASTILVPLILIWGLSQYVYFLPLKQAFLISTPLDRNMSQGFDTFSNVLLISMYVFTPLMVLILFILRIKQTSRKKPAKTQNGGRFWAWNRTITALSFSTILMVSSLLWSYDGLKRSQFQINAAARQGQWTQVLRQAGALPKGKSNISCNHDINRALYHTDKLLDEMCSFPQNPHALLLTQEGELSSLIQLQLCEVHAELGNMNMAEKMASELLAIEGGFGVIIEKLAWINIFKGQTRTACTYLNALRKDLIYRGRAGRILQGFREGFKPSQAAYIDRVKASVPEDRYSPVYGGGVEDILIDLLKCNPHNKMAFEYLMAYYLLTRQVQKVAMNMDRLRDLGYQRVPMHLEEAMLIYYGLSGQKVDLTKVGISRATYQRYLAFVQLDTASQRSNQQTALNRLVREFGASYFFYFKFGRVGAI